MYCTNVNPALSFSYIDKIIHVQWYKNVKKYCITINVLIYDNHNVIGVGFIKFVIQKLNYHLKYVRYEFSEKT